MNKTKAAWTAVEPDEHTWHTRLRSSLTRLLTPTLQCMLSVWHTLALHARLTLLSACISKEVNISFGQRSVGACKTNVQMYTYIDLRADFHPKVTTCEVRVYTVTTFGHPRCWWFANSRFSTWDHLIMKVKEIGKQKSRKEKKTWTSLEICE